MTLSPFLSKRTGVPVRIDQPRRNMFDCARQFGNIHIKLGFTDDGMVTAAESISCETTGIYPKAIQLDLDCFRTLKCPNLHSISRSYYTNTVRADTNRGYRWKPGIMSSGMETVSGELGMDVLEVMQKNFHTPEPSLKANIDLGKAKYGWNWHPANSKKLLNGRMHGITAQAAAQGTYGGFAEITLYMGDYNLNDGKVYIPFGSPRIHGGVADATCMVVAEELGAKLEDVIGTYCSWNSPNSA